MTRTLDPLVSLSLRTDEALALRHLFVWLEGVENESQPTAYGAEFTEREREILAGLRRLFVEYEFPASAL